MQTIKNKRGFSLIELSVVMVIIGILIYMTLVAGRQQLEMARIKQTQFKLQKIQTALAVYLKTYGYLPCPADGTVAWGDTQHGFGVQAVTPVADSIVSDTYCTNVNLITSIFPYNVAIGVIPVTTLGMSSDSMIDGWGNRITYIVSRNCVDPDNWNANNLYKCTDVGGTTSGVGSLISLKGINNVKWTDSVPYVIISNGKSGYGAWNYNGVRNGGQASSSTGEACNGNFSSGNGSLFTGANGCTTYYDQQVNDGDITGKYFDNIVAWSTAQQIYYNASH